jgi:anaerobic magnesium-protoporphyrin IX monomethyl ester cyclase
MKIVLIRPPEINRVWAGIPHFFNNGIFLFPPLGIMQLKVYIEKYTPHEVIIYDSLIHKADYKKIASFIRKVSPQVVGISTFTHSLLDVVETAKAIKEANPLIHIVLGGPHTYTFPEESKHLLGMGCIDSVVLGDGEEVFRDLLKALDTESSLEGIAGIIYKDKSGNITKIGAPAFIDNLDSLPFPSRDICGVKYYYTPASHGHLMATMITSRGCPYNCKFCDTGKKYRSRSIENVVEEMVLCSKSGFKEIFFIDDTFNINIERVVQLSEEILRRGVKIKWGCKARCDNVDREMLEVAREAGCVRIHYGVETGVTEGLDSIEKRITLAAARDALVETKKAGIRTVAYFIIGCPHEKHKADILETINFARSLPADYAVFSLLSPYPDTVFYKEGVAKGIFDPELWKGFIERPISGTELPTCWDEHFSKEELLFFLKLAHRKFYYRRKIILNSLFHVHSFIELKRLLTGGLSLLKLDLSSSPDGGL